MRASNLLSWIPAFVLLTAFLQNPAAQDYAKNPAGDPKGTVFLIHGETITPDGASRNLIPGVIKAMEDMKKTDEKAAPLQFLEISGKDAQELAKNILSLPPDTLKNLGGIIRLTLEIPLKTNTQENSQALIEVYHYPLPPMTQKYIESPEYSFKFGSDSALLAISLYESLSVRENKNDDVCSTATISPAASANPYLPRDLLRKSVQVTLKSRALGSRESAGLLAKKIVRALQSFASNEKCYAMGLLSEKVQRHQKPGNIEIRVFKFIQPNKDFSEEESKKREAEMKKVAQTVKPFSSNLFFIKDLDRLAPYSFKAIDTTRQEKDFWYEVDQGAFVASSLTGIVRTIPNKFPRYAPLENKYVEEKEEPAPVKKLDYVIEGATVFNGKKGSARLMTDVGISGEKIALLGSLKDIPRDATIDGRGLFLTPGFIDIHSHADWNIMKVPSAPYHIRQGITTVLAGNCASSPLGVGSFYREAEKSGIPLNIGLLIGNKPVRETVLGKRKGQPSYEEVYREKELVDLAMEEGAFGLSSGLIYSISEQAFTWELAELSKQLKPYGGFYASHVRGESEDALDAIREAIYIGEIAEVPVQISHIKVIGRANWGDMKRYLEIMKDARARGLDVTGDQYPWRSTGPAAHYRLYRILVRDAIKRETPEVVLLKDMPGKYAKYSGRLLTELLEAEHITTEDLIKDLNLTPESPIFATYLCLGEGDVILPMKEDFIMVCTDASLVSPEEMEKGKSKDDHPRRFRSYPEFFGKYVRDKNVCSWEMGVYKCTGLPAERMKLKDRGVIRPGAYADLVLFDPEKIHANADYRDQSPPPLGIVWVFLNGRPVLKSGEFIPLKAGRALRAYGNQKP